MMARKVSTLPALVAIGGHPYMIDGGAIDDVRDGCNIYPELAPGWDGAPLALDDVDHGETIDIMGRRYQVNALSDLELVALAMPGESEYEGPDLCAACGAPMDDGDPLRAFCPNGPHILPEYGPEERPDTPAERAASLIGSALEILNPDDGTAIFNIMPGDSREIVLFDFEADGGPVVSCRVTVEILDYDKGATNA